MWTSVPAAATIVMLFSERIPPTNEASNFMCTPVSPPTQALVMSMSFGPMTSFTGSVDGFFCAWMTADSSFNHSITFASKVGSLPMAGPACAPFWSSALW